MSFFPGGSTVTYTGRTLTTGSSYTMLSTDINLVVNKVSGSATAITLPNSPTLWAHYTVKDGKGDAAANPITITSSIGNIEGSASFILSVNFAQTAFVYNGSNWNVIGTYTPYATSTLAQQTAAQTYSDTDAMLIAQPSKTGGSLSTLWRGTLSQLFAYIQGKLPAGAFAANSGDYIIGVVNPGTLQNNQVLIYHTLPHVITFPAGLAGSSAKAKVAATGTSVFTLAYIRAGNTTTIATFTFAAAGTTATIANIAIPTLQAGDDIILTGGASDSTLANVGFTILGAKT